MFSVPVYLGDCEIDGLLSMRSGGLLPPLPASRLLQVQVDAQTHAAVCPNCVVARPQRVVSLQEQLVQRRIVGREGQRGDTEGNGRVFGDRTMRTGNMVLPTSDQACAVIHQWCPEPPDEALRTC